MAHVIEVCQTEFSEEAHCAGRMIEDNFVTLLREKQCRDDNLEMLEIYLVEGIINVISCDLWHVTKVIRTIAECKDEEVICKLMENGTLLRTAVSVQCFCVVEYFLEMVRKLDEEINYFNALHIAASTPCAKITKILLKDGADVNAIDEDGRTPLFHAVLYDHFVQCRILLRYGATIDTTGPSNLFHAIFPRNDPFSVAIIRLLLDAGLNPNTKSDDGAKTILHEVANNAQLRGSTRCSKLLIKYGANKNAKTKNGDAVLHLAANASSNATFIRWLIHNKVDLNVKNAKKENFLDIITKKDDINTREAIITGLMRYLLVEQIKNNFQYDFRKMRMTDREKLEYLLCREELDNLKQIKLNNKLPFTLFHILIWSEYRIAKLRVDPGLDNDEISRFRTRYPKYGDQLRINYLTGLRRMRAENVGIELVEDILGERLGTDIVRKIVDCFSMRDLEFWRQDEN